MSAPHFRYLGANRGGTTEVGAFTTSVANFVQAKFVARWGSLTVTTPDGKEEVGGIVLDDRGRRTWWGFDGDARDYFGVVVDA